MRPSQPFTVILGTNEIASAIAVHMHRGGHRVVLSHDPSPPVIRRKMAFHDALFEDAVIVEGIAASRVDSGLDIRSAHWDCASVLITELGLLDLIVLQSIDILVDARMQKYQATPDLRRLAKFTIGIGPGFCGSMNCDVAIETRPGKEGLIIAHGETDAPDGTARRLGNRWGERFVHAEFPGRWHTAIEIGTRVFRDFVIGHLGNMTIRAPFDGILRGVVRDGTEVPAGVKLLEIDPRGRRANWTGIDNRSRTIAKAVVQAVSLRQSATAEKSRSTLHLVK